MSMTKKEREEVEQLKTMLALRFYPEVEPDIDIPERLSGETTNGWTCNPYSERVEKACTTSIHHGIGCWNKTTSQEPMRLYSTEKKAYQALLGKMAKRFAIELREVERRMENC